MKEYGISWNESAGRGMHLVGKQKFFKTEAARDAYVTYLEAKDNFVEILAWHN